MPAGPRPVNKLFAHGSGLDGLMSPRALQPFESLPRLKNVWAGDPLVARSMKRAGIPPGPLPDHSVLMTKSSRPVA